MDKTLITIDDISRYRPVSKLIPTERIQPFIRESQVQDLLPVLGDTLYYDLLDKFDNTGSAMFTKYQELLGGKLYTPPGYSTSIIFAGIIPMLSYFSLARYYQNSQVSATSYGLVQKNSEYATPMTSQGVQGSVEYLRSLGISYQESLVKFLIDNNTDYPLFSTGVKGIQNDIGVKFFSV
jgi:hypothetical protein